MFPLVNVRRKRNDITTLVNGLGGSAVVPAFYDVRYGITTAGGVASAWNDARGATGFGPQLASTGTNRPGFSSTTLDLTFDGIDDYLTSAASALFALNGAMSLFYVGSVPTLQDHNPCGICESAVAARALLVQGVTITPKIGAFIGAGATTIASAVGTGTTRRLTAISKNASTTGRVQVASQTAVTGAITTIASSANNQLTVGDYFPASSPMATVARALIVLSGAYTAAQLAAVSAWAQAIHTAVTA